MKHNKFLITILLFTIHCSLFTAYSQSWQELIDSTKIFRQKKNYNISLQWAKKALVQLEKESRQNDTNYAATLSYVSELFYNLGKLDSAIFYGDKHLKLCRILFKSDHPDLASSINNLAAYFATVGNKIKAEQMFIEALEMKRRIYKGDNPGLTQTMNSLAALYIEKGDLLHAEPLLAEALAMRRRLFRDDNKYLATSIIKMAGLYQEKGDYKQAEPLFEESLKMYKRIYKGDHPELATVINNVAAFYNIIGEYQKAELLYNESLEMLNRIYKMEHPHLAGSINNLAMFYMDRGDYKTAEPLISKSLNMYKKIFRGDHPNLALILGNTAGFYILKGDYKQAELLFKKSLEMYRRIYSEDNHGLARSINHLGYFYLNNNDYQKAEPLLKESLEMHRRLFKGDHPDLAISINNMASFFNTTGKYNLAEPLYKEAHEMILRIFKGDHPNIAKSYNNMAGFYNIIGDYKQAESLFVAAFEMNKRIYKNDNPELAEIINNLASIYNSIGDYRKAEQFFNELMIISSNLINNYFPSLSEIEKQNYFNIFSKYYTLFNNFAVFRYKESSNLLETMFNNQLLTKGMLLKASNKVRNRILSSNDTSLIQLFNSWKDKKGFISKLLQLSNMQLKLKGIDLDSVIETSNEQEKEITKRSEIFKKEYDKQKFVWKDIQNNLGNHDVAIEIIRLNYITKNRKTDTVYYATLILKKNSKYPDLVLIKNGNDLESDYISNYKNSIINKLEDKESYDKFWAPIAKKLKGIKRVYISPDGVYNQINLLTLQNPKTGKYVIDEIDIQVVGSTRDLVERHTTESSLKSGEKYLNTHLKNDKLIAELFGNPQFNLDSTEYNQVASRYVDNTERSYYYLGNTLDSTTRKGIASLPGTKTEIENISSILTNNKCSVNSHLGPDAVEEAIKSLRNPTILHIATHGMFLRNIETKEDNILGMETQRVRENPLLRSMLLLSGAENTLKNEGSQYQQTDDGLLTAYEAMNLNLDKTELVVLSACETGLGEIKNGEGVYGLQRAFQQAGAKSLIMSLWKVNDQTTQELMTSFYTKWLAGKTKRDAFKETQLELKRKYPEPYYWGAFVMAGE